MKSALIGYTGFVGGTISNQYSFNECYNSKNVKDIRGKTYDFVVCAGAPGKKWLANKEPERDKESIDALIQNISNVKTRNFILISTVDVYPLPNNVDEDSVIDESKQQPYGLNRLRLEKFVSRYFSNHTIVRLPALFGKGLKKNFIYDLINDRMLDYTHPESEFQFFNTINLWKDINRAINKSLKLINFATEPIKAGDIAEKVGLNLTPNEELKIVKYDVHTKYADRLGTSGNYIYQKEEIMKNLVGFINKERQSKK